MNIDEYIKLNEHRVQIIGSWKNRAILFVIQKKQKNKYPAKLFTYNGTEFNYITNKEELLQIGKYFQKIIITQALKIIDDFDSSNFVGLYKNNLVWHVYKKEYENSIVGIPIYLLFDGKHFKFPINPQESAEIRKFDLSKYD